MSRDPWDVPGAPSKPTILDWTPTFVDLSWMPPENNGGSPITAYIIGIIFTWDIFLNIKISASSTLHFLIHLLPRGARNIHARLAGKHYSGSEGPRGEWSACNGV
jgi:hypothetical protein